MNPRIPFVDISPAHYDTLSGDIRKAFKREHLYRVTVAFGTELYKLTHREAVGPGGAISPDPEGFVTPWWCVSQGGRYDLPDHDLYVRGIDDVLLSAERTGASLQRFLRRRAAVCLDWSVMSHILVARTKRAIEGYFGVCSGQAVFWAKGSSRAARFSNVDFIGGEQQVCLARVRPQALEVLAFSEKWK